MPRFTIILKPTARRDLDRLRSFDAAKIADGIERVLGDQPARERGSRIKRLKGIADPDYRLRLDEHRVFYNVNTEACRVDVLRILHKSETLGYYKELRP